MNRFVWFLFVFSFSFSSLHSQVKNHNFKATKATLGSGLHKEKIWWINWDINNNNLGDDILSKGVSGKYLSPSGYIYNISLEMIPGNTDPIISSKTDDYNLNSFPSGYNTFSPSSNVLAIKNGNNGTTSKFRLTITSSDPYGNVSIPKGFVIAGSESLSGSGEYYTLDISKNTAGTLRVIDKYIVNDNWGNFNIDVIASNNGKTVKATQATGSGDGRGDVMLFAEGVSSIDVELKGGGRQHIALGFMEDIDYSDGPHVYGLAWHLVNSSLSGGTFTNGTTKINTSSNTQEITSTTSQIAKPVLPQLLLGYIVDSDYLAPQYPELGAAPEIDDNHNLDDEDALPQEITWFDRATTRQNLDIPVLNNTGKDAYLYLWLDANNNGKFELSERLEKVITSNAFTQEPRFDLKAIGDLSGGIYYVRLRISSQKDLQPTDFAPDGEVEDHMIAIIQQPYNIMGSIFFDENAGIPSGRLLKNIRVELYDQNNIFITSQLTSKIGAYLFQNLPYGDYKVKVVLPSSKYNHVSSTDSTPTDGETSVTIDNAGHKIGINFGIYNSICQKPAPITSGGLPTTHGITALGKIKRGTSNWPQIRTGAWTALESRDTSFVINRVPANLESNGGQVPSITEPKKGMIIYDTTNNCLKIYNGTSWKCFNTFSCPE